MPIGLAFAPLATDFDRQIDHGFQRFQRYAGFELPQVASGEPAEVLIELDIADRVDRIDLEAAIDDDQPGTRREHLAGDARQEGLRQPLDDGGIGHVQHDRGELRLIGPGQLFGRVGSDDDLQIAGPLAKLLPIGRPFEHDQQRPGVRLCAELRRQVENGSELGVKSLRFHAGYGASAADGRWRSE